MSRCVNSYIQHTVKQFEDPMVALSVYRHYLAFDLTPPWTAVGVSNAKEHIKETLGTELTGQSPELPEFLHWWLSEGVRGVACNELFALFKRFATDRQMLSGQRLGHNGFVGRLNGLLLKHNLPAKQYRWVDRDRHIKEQGFFKMTSDIVHKLLELEFKNFDDDATELTEPGE